MANTHEIGVRPKPFTGDRTTSADFLVRFRMFLRDNGTRYNTDDLKMSLFLALCEGNIAGKWATAISTQILDDEDQAAIAAAASPPTTHTPAYPNYNVLIAQFKKDFAPLDADTAARRELENIQMTSDDVTEYITKFNALVPQTGYDGQALVHFYKKGLKTGLWKACMVVLPVPKTFDQWVATSMERSTLR